MDPADNLNLIQPVNPWTGNQWQFYTEYFQWQPTRNSNSESYPIPAGDHLRGTLVYNANDDSYLLTQTHMEAGRTSSQVVQCQSGKKYTLPYVVFEKTWACKDYPQDGKVEFYDIVAQCDGIDCADEIQWKAVNMVDMCDFNTHITEGTRRNISITWDPTMNSVYDDWSEEDLFAHNVQSSGASYHRLVPQQKRH